MFGEGAETEESAACELSHLVEESLTQPKSNEDATGVLLADHTTLRVGGPARRFVTATTTDELISLVTECDRAGEPVFVLGGGSNVLVGDEGFAGTVIKVDTRGLEAEESSCGGAVVRVQAGESWDDFVAYAIAHEWSGIEALSGIPGSVGSTVIQNVGAYGADVSQTVYRVRTLDRLTGEYATFSNSECEFGYRSSRFKSTRFGDSPTGRYVVLDVTFQFLLGSMSAPIRYRELARHLGVEVGSRVDAGAVRQAVCDIRSTKAMVLNPADHDTWSAGSFFTNPIVDQSIAEQLPEDAPRFPTEDGHVKLSAAWLISHSGLERGFGLHGPTSAATLSTKHVLALTNRGTARAADVIELARHVRARVHDTFGITLVPEPVCVGADLG